MTQQPQGDHVAGHLACEVRLDITDPRGQNRPRDQQIEKLCFKRRDGVISFRAPQHGRASSFNAERAVKLRHPHRSTLDEAKDQIVALVRGQFLGSFAADVFIVAI
jgi:hypothetical protein